MLRGNTQRSMAHWSICMLILAAAQLLGIANICRAKDLPDQEYQRTSRISPRFDPEELIKMKEALKGESGLPGRIYGTFFPLDPHFGAGVRFWHW